MKTMHVRKVSPLEFNNLEGTKIMVLLKSDIKGYVENDSILFQEIDTDAVPSHTGRFMKFRITAIVNSGYGLYPDQVVLSLSFEKKSVI